MQFTIYFLPTEMRLVPSGLSCMLTTPVLCADISLYIWLESSVPVPVLGPGGEPDPGPDPEPIPVLERTGTEEEEEEEGELVFRLTGGQL